MDIECAVKDLREAASLAQRFSSKQAQLEALQGILLIAEGKTLTLRATNLECGVEVSIPAKINKSGLCAIHGSTLSALVGNMPASARVVNLSVSGNLLFVSSEKSKSHIKTLPHEDFPILPSVSADNTFSIDSQTLASLMRSVAFCASTSSIKPELQSILLYVSDGKLVAAATDSFRLAEKQILYKGDSLKLLIPIKNAAELIRILEDAKGFVDIYFSDNQLSVRVEGIYFTTRLIDANFPNYRQIIPTSHTTEAVVLKEDLAQALRSISVFADKYAQVTVFVQPKKKGLTLSSRNTDVGEHTITLSAAAEGEDVEMNFNGRYIADSLQSIVGESVRVAFSGAGKPLCLGSSQDKNFTYIVMPMNR